MGSPCELRLYSTNKKSAQGIADAAILEVHRLEKKYSRYREDSVTSDINNTAGNINGIEVDAGNSTAVKLCTGWL